MSEKVIERSAGNPQRDDQALCGRLVDLALSSPGAADKKNSLLLIERGMSSRWPDSREVDRLLPLCDHHPQIVAQLASTILLQSLVRRKLQLEQSAAEVSNNGDIDDLARRLLAEAISLLDRRSEFSDDVHERTLAALQTALERHWWEDAFRNLCKRIAQVLLAQMSFTKSRDLLLHCRTFIEKLNTEKYFWSSPSVRRVLLDLLQSKDDALFSCAVKLLFLHNDDDFRRSVNELREAECAGIARHLKPCPESDPSGTEACQQALRFVARLGEAGRPYESQLIPLLPRQPILVTEAWEAIKPVSCTGILMWLMEKPKKWEPAVWVAIARLLAPYKAEARAALGHLVAGFTVLQSLKPANGTEDPVNQLAQLDGGDSAPDELRRFYDATNFYISAMKAISGDLESETLIDRLLDQVKKWDAARGRAFTFTQSYHIAITAIERGMGDALLRSEWMLRLKDLACTADSDELRWAAAMKLLQFADETLRNGFCDILLESGSPLVIMAVAEFLAEADPVRFAQFAPKLENACYLYPLGLDGRLAVAENVAEWGKQAARRLSGEPRSSLTSMMLAAAAVDPDASGHLETFLNEGC